MARTRPIPRRSRAPSWPRRPACGRLECATCAGCYFASGISNQYFDAWLATGLTQGEQALEAEEEGLRVRRFAPGHVEEMIRAGTIADAATVAVFGLRGMAGDEDRNQTKGERG